jgi:hypothetical protein
MLKLGMLTHQLPYALKHENPFLKQAEHQNEQWYFRHTTNLANCVVDTL